MIIMLIARLLAFPLYFRQMGLAKTRPMIGECEFVSRIARAGGDETAARIVYNKLLECVYADGFTPYPEDDIGSIYGLAEEDLDEDIILDTLDQMGIPTPRQDVVFEFGAIDTALKIAVFVKRVRPA